MKLSFGDNAAAVADPQVKVGVEKGIAVSSGLGEERAGMVTATLSLVATRRLSAATRRLSGSSVQVDFEINIPAEESASADADDVAESLASADEDSLNSALSEAIASIADAGYSVAVAELPSVDPIVTPIPAPTLAPLPTDPPAPTLAPTPAPTAAPVYVMLHETGICEAPGYTTAATSVEECAIICDTQIVGCVYFSYASGSCKLTDECDDVAASSAHSVYMIEHMGVGGVDTLNYTPRASSCSMRALLSLAALLACLQG